MNGQCKRRDWDAEVLRGTPPSVCTHITRCSRRGRPPCAWIRRVSQDTFMAIQVRARMASASGVIGILKCWVDARHRFAHPTSGVLVVDAHRACGFDIFGLIPLCPPRHAHEWPVEAEWMRSRKVGGTPAVGGHPTHPVCSSWTPTVPVGGTFLDRYFYGHPRTRTNGPRKRRSSETEMSGETPAVGEHPQHPVFSSWTPTVGVVSTSLDK